MFPKEWQSMLGADVPRTWAYDFGCLSEGAPQRPNNLIKPTGLGPRGTLFSALTDTLKL